MFFKDHHCRSYCIYLGSVTLDGHNYDLGVYENPKWGEVSHAIIYGPEPWEYISGEFIFNNKLCGDWSRPVCQLNKSVYGRYLNENLNQLLHPRGPRA